VTGFLAGTAVDVAIGELPKLTGTSSKGDNAWRELGTWIGGLGDVHRATVLVGAAALLVILAVRFAAPAVPGALVLLVGGLIASSLFDLEARGVAVVGGRAARAPDARAAGSHARQGPLRNHRRRGRRTAPDRLLPDRGRRQGIRCTAWLSHRRQPGVHRPGDGQRRRRRFQGMPVSTSLSASSLNEPAGARTPVASLVSGALVLATLVALAPLFSHLPKAILAAVIIDAVVFGMIDLAELRRLRRVARFDFWVAVAAISGVLSAGVLAGVVIGAVLSLGWLVFVATRPAMPLLGREAGRRCSATSASTRTMRRSRASWSCASTAGSSSPPPKRSRTGCAAWPWTAARRARSCSTWRA
jgi:sulfate permease, SulP family